MHTCHYEFQYDNIYWTELEEAILKLFAFSPEDYTEYVGSELAFILYKKDKNNFVLFKQHRCIDLQLVIVKCDKRYEEALRKIFYDICELAEEDFEESYVDNYRAMIKDVSGEDRTFFSDFVEEYKLTGLLDFS